MAPKGVAFHMRRHICGTRLASCLNIPFPFNKPIPLRLSNTRSAPERTPLKTGISGCSGTRRSCRLHLVSTGCAVVGQKLFLKCVVG